MINREGPFRDLLHSPEGRGRPDPSFVSVSIALELNLVLPKFASLSYNGREGRSIGFRPKFLQKGASDGRQMGLLPGDGRRGGACPRGACGGDGPASGPRSGQAGPQKAAAKKTAKKAAAKKTAKKAVAKKPAKKAAAKKPAKKAAAKKTAKKTTKKTARK